MSSARVRFLLAEKKKEKVLPPEKVQVAITILGLFEDIDSSPPPLPILFFTS